jgi:hypothetical protein
MGHIAIYLREQRLLDDSVAGHADFALAEPPQLLRSEAPACLAANASPRFVSAEYPTRTAAHSETSQPSTRVFALLEMLQYAEVCNTALISTTGTMQSSDGKQLG